MKWTHILALFASTRCIECWLQARQASFPNTALSSFRIIALKWNWVCTYPATFWAIDGWERGLGVLFSFWIWYVGHVAQIVLSSNHLSSVRVSCVLLQHAFAVWMCWEGQLSQGSSVWLRPWVTVIWCATTCWCAPSQVQLVGLSACGCHELTCAVLHTEANASVVWTSLNEHKLWCIYTTIS